MSLYLKIFFLNYRMKGRVQTEVKKLREMNFSAVGYRGTFLKVNESDAVHIFHKSCEVAVFIK